MSIPKRIEPHPVSRIIDQVDSQIPGELPPDTVPSGFPSLDRFLGGGLRRKDLVVLGGDVGSGKSALVIGIGLRAAEGGFPVALVSGEMDEERILERALAIESRSRVDEIRTASFSLERRAAIGAVALRLQDLPFHVYAMAGARFDEVLSAARRHEPALLIVDYLQLLPPPATKPTLEEDNAAALRALKALTLDHNVACLAVAQLPLHRPDRRDPRPTLNDFGVLGTVKQHADVVLGLYREEMYNPGAGVEGAAELIIAKNRNGATGFVDLYFYQEWMRFEDMVDPDR